jgi:hypothetical protein
MAVAAENPINPNNAADINCTRNTIAALFNGNLKHCADGILNLPK